MEGSNAGAMIDMTSKTGNHEDRFKAFIAESEPIFPDELSIAQT